ncbi:VOC family protein, partial [bacterium]|nr:VOC family protein [bacterium]
MQKITPNLWFNGNAKEAVDFYASVFPDVKIITTSYYPKSQEEGLADFQLNLAGKILAINFEIMGFRFVAINAGPEFVPNPSISFHVKCKTIEEADELWAKLSEGGKVLMEYGKQHWSERYGWTNDAYGISWQIMFVVDEPVKQKITPVLMFVGAVCGKAEEAVNFYASVFENSKVGHILRYKEEDKPNKTGTVTYATLSLSGQEFGVMDSGHDHTFKFNEAVSLSVACQDQS